MLYFILVILSTFLKHPIHPAFNAASRSEYRKPVCTYQNWRATVTPDEAFIISRESDWSTADYNPVETSTGHAFGLGQLTDENREKYARRLGVDSYTRNPCDQLTMMRWYEHDRYGSSTRAVAWWRDHGWY